MRPGPNRPLLADHDHAYGMDPGVSSGEFYSRLQRSIHRDNDADEQSSGETLGRFQLDDSGLDYHKQSPGALIPDLLSSESSRSSISQLPEYHMGTGGNSQHGFSRNHSALMRKVAQVSRCPVPKHCRSREAHVF